MGVWVFIHCVILIGAVGALVDSPESLKRHVN